jgi:hypothetical protein
MMNEPNEISQKQTDASVMLEEVLYQQNSTHATESLSVNKSEVKQPFNNSVKYDEEISDKTNSILTRSNKNTRISSSEEFVLKQFHSSIKWKINENFLIKFLIIM